MEGRSHLMEKSCTTIELSLSCQRAMFSAAPAKAVAAGWGLKCSHPPPMVSSLHIQQDRSKRFHWDSRTFVGWRIIPAKSFAEIGTIRLTYLIQRPKFTFSMNISHIMNPQESGHIRDSKRWECPIIGHRQCWTIVPLSVSSPLSATIAAVYNMLQPTSTYYYNLLSLLSA